MKQQVQQPNRFLENQARIMGARRLQAEQRKADEAKQIPAGAGEKETPQRIFDPNANTFTVESSNPHGRS